MSRLFLAITGLLYLGLSLWCSLDPVTTSEKVGFEVQPGSGQSEFLVIYGGLEMALAVLFLAPLFNRQYVSAALQVCIVVHVCLVIFRSIGFLLYAGFAPMTYQLAAGEWIILILAVLAYRYDAKDSLPA